jgi:hypothetical protein
MTHDREFIESLARMMSHVIARSPDDHVAQIVAREIAEHVATYPTPSATLPLVGASWLHPSPTPADPPVAAPTGGP